MITLLEYQKIPTLYKFDTKKKRYTQEYSEPVFEYLETLTWLCSEKIDGTNIRVYWDGHKVSWSGRTDKSELPKEVEALLQETFADAEVIFEQTVGEKEAFLFMECYGGKIQGGNYGGKERLIGFDVMINGTYLERTAIQPIFDLFNIPVVKMYRASLIEAIQDVEMMRQYKMVSDYCEKGTTEIEGLVCVPEQRLYDAKGHRIIVKIKVEMFKKM